MAVAYLWVSPCFVAALILYGIHNVLWGDPRLVGSCMRCCTRDKACTLAVTTQATSTVLETNSDSYYLAAFVLRCLVVKNLFQMLTFSQMVFQ